VEASAEAEVETAPEVEVQKEAVAASLETEVNGDTMDKNEPSESTTKAHITASLRPVVDGASDVVDSIQKVAKRETGGEAFKVVYEGEGVAEISNMTIDQQTDF